MSTHNSTAKSISNVRDSKTRTTDFPKGDATLRKRCAKICRQYRDFALRIFKIKWGGPKDKEKETLDLGLKIAKQIIELDTLLTTPGCLDMLCEVGDLSGHEVFAVQHIKWLARNKPLSDRFGAADCWISTDEAEGAVFDACGSDCDESEVEYIEPEEHVGQIWNPDITDLPAGLSLEELYWHVLHNTLWDGWQTPRILDEMLRRKKLTAEHCQEWIAASGFTCQGGLHATKGFLEHRGVPVDSTLAWLKSKGIHCDLDVITELCLGVTCFRPKRHVRRCKMNTTTDLSRIANTSQLAPRG